MEQHWRDIRLSVLEPLLRGIGQGLLPQAELLLIVFRYSLCLASLEFIQHAPSHPPVRNLRPKSLSSTLLNNKPEARVWLCEGWCSSAVQS